MDMAGKDSDKQELLDSIQAELKKGLKLGSKNVQKLSYSQLQRSQGIRIKMEYNEERRTIHMPRPLTFEQIRDKVEQMYSYPLCIFFTQANGEVYIPIKCQADLDSAIHLVDKNERVTSLRLFLTNSNHTGHHGFPNSHHIASDPYKSNNRESPSPPPGSLPEHERSYNHSLSCSSINSEGEFIPEKDTPGSISDSLSSLDSSYVSSHGDTYPMIRGRRDSRRSILSDGAKDEYDGRGSRFGTYPRGFDSGTHSANVEGHGTFPRSNIVQHRRPELTTTSLRSLMSTRGSEGTLSTSSSSSGFPPDPEDSPEGRIFKRNSNDGSPIFHPAFSKSPTCPSNWKQGHRLGSGAFGEVFICFDHDTGRELAVKMVKLHGQNAEVSKEARALENEIILLRNFQHERIVQYFGCSVDRSEICIFMEYMPGGSIFDIINKYGPLTEPVAAKYTRQVLEGLAYLHRNVIVHRDIKGANVLRDSAGNVKLADFGTSKRLQTICSVSGLKSIIGTPYWMAPEVINGETYGRKADVWSVGCTIVEMLTKKPPWADLETMAAIYKIATTEFPRFTLPNGLSPYVDDFLRLTFKRIPQERPTAEDLLMYSFVNR
ncbi:mitogen-activated protein kinase kinase kinase 3-like [Mercenaria mercenaria]|uniref:mitogen-activated protein kinase kinase kinase 3-like n=1 Tax=Mercenaria mercenaria TaxID=6596 RepID=UPI00234E9F61|nr:mitogen-activated protein kinase kinase kinase 3-like [Mercenaria mercenaria]XP_053385542.1 mitogen-activated protein kinase kinase kinase 3-like [Mercenaria mercenaria]